MLYIIEDMFAQTILNDCDGVNIFLRDQIREVIIYFHN